MPVLSPHDEGKYLVDASGKQYGIVTDVDQDADVAYVDPDPDLVEALRETFGDSDADDDDIRVPQETIEAITDDELQLAETL